ncbi:LOW QUALITY PROTEIN: hypothetical protein TorRG33x02_120910 [Trema orientale]|uniref:Uncharacterized protein n=1 Tax=Trema orientale TaxID=63057 RepID=A0A2P5F2P4_TREOI|nr:LOW QUALITY PROTEIN: hypothetical protein TorRG33x02_120910 [Trema orientale]
MIAINQPKDHSPNHLLVHISDQINPRGVDHYFSVVPHPQDRIKVSQSPALPARALQVPTYGSCNSPPIATNPWLPDHSSGSSPSFLHHHPSSFFD